MAGQQEREGDTERRDYRTHKLHRFRAVNAADQQTIGKQRHGFIHRTAEVEGRHGAKDGAQQETRAALHRLQQVDQRVLQPGNGLADQSHHQQTANNGA